MKSKSESGMIDRRQFMAGSAAAAAMFSASMANAAQPLRLAISLIDIPRLWGSPDGGFEGMRFGGYPIYNSLAIWDLSQGDGPCQLVPGLATSWKHDDTDKTRFIVTLRENVKFHDGSPFDADAAIWNFESVFNEKAPQYFATRAAATKSRMPTVIRAEKIDDKTIAVITAMPDASVIYQISFLLFVSPTHYAKLGNDWAKFSLNPSGTGAFKVAALVPRTRLDLVRNADYWERVVVAGVCMQADTVHPYFAIAKQINVQFVFGLRPNRIHGLPAGDRRGQHRRGTDDHR